MCSETCCYTVRLDSPAMFKHFMRVRSCALPPGGRTRSFLLNQQFSTHALGMAFLARLFLGLCLLLFADTVVMQSLGEVLPKK